MLLIMGKCLVGFPKISQPLDSKNSFQSSVFHLIQKNYLKREATVHLPQPVYFSVRRHKLFFQPLVRQNLNLYLQYEYQNILKNDQVFRYWLQHLIIYRCSHYYRLFCRPAGIRILRQTQYFRPRKASLGRGGRT